MVGKQFEWSYDLTSANQIKIHVPKGVNWNGMKAAGLKPQYGAFILAQLVYRLQEKNSVSDWATLSSVALERLHRQYKRYLNWFIQEGILQVQKNLKGKDTYRGSGKGLHFSKSYRFSPAFIRNSAGWMEAKVSDKRAVRAYKNFIAYWADSKEQQVSSSIARKQTENIKALYTNTNKHNITNDSNKQLYMFSVSAEEQGKVAPIQSTGVSNAPARAFPSGEVDQVARQILSFELPDSDPLMEAFNATFGANV